MISLGPNGEIDFAGIYVMGLAIGLPPSELDRLSLQQVCGIFHAWSRGQVTNALSEAEADELFEWISA